MYIYICISVAYCCIWITGYISSALHNFSCCEPPANGPATVAESLKG